MKLKWYSDRTSNVKLTLDNIGKPDTTWAEIDSFEAFSKWIKDNNPPPGALLCFRIAKADGRREDLKIAKPEINWKVRAMYAEDVPCMIISKDSDEKTLKLAYEHAKRAVVYVEHAQTMNEFMCDAAELSVQEVRKEIKHDMAETDLDEIFGPLDY